MNINNASYYKPIETFEEIESALDNGLRVFEGGLTVNNQSEVIRTLLDDDYYKHPRRDPYYVEGVDKYIYNIVCRENNYTIGLQHRRTCECCNGTGLNGDNFFIVG